MNESLQGGTRTRGQSPVKQAGLPVISVITVVYNGLNLIEKTIRSVLSQTYPNLEYIVIDGCSSDGTVEIIRLYEDQINYWISERDGGIYDAMNKGLAAASGDYVWFINAGDLIYSEHILEKIFIEKPYSTLEKKGLIYYGDTMIVDPEYREIGLRRLRPPEVLTWKSFRKGMLVCHQAIIVSREIAEPFDLQYKHSADFDWVLRALMKAEGKEARGQKGKEKDKSLRIKTGLHVSTSAHQHISTSAHQIISTSNNQHIINTRLVLCAFLDGGHSKQNIAISLKERYHSMVRHYGLIPTLLRHIPIAVRFGWYFMRNKRF